jgi:hypothetical protein
MCVRQLAGCETVYGIDHNETRTSAINLRGLLVECGEDARAAEIALSYKL